MLGKSGKYLIIALLSGLCLVWWHPVLAQENINTTFIDERIESFHANFAVATDSSFKVTETIVYNFGSTTHHGIYRDIPYHYTRSGSSYNVRLKVLAVTDENGESIKYSLRKWSGDLRITIGDSKIYVTGVKTYKITYTVQRAINYFADHDELYWNLTGNDWLVGIDNASALIQLPQVADPDKLQLSCYTGLYGATESWCDNNIIEDGIIAFNSQTTFFSGEGMTFVVGFPKGLVNPPATSQSLAWFVQDNWIILIPILVLVMMFYLWYSRGRDPKVKGTVIPYYEPPHNLPSAEVGTIVDEKADIKDLSSSIIQLAVKGFLKIKEIETKKLLGNDRDYELIKLREADETLRNYEKKIFEGIFESGQSRTVSSMKNKFYKHLQGIKDALYEAVVQEGYFPTSPEGVRHLYIGIGVFILITGGFILFFLNNTVGGVGTLFSGMVAMVFAGRMPRKTMKGVETNLLIRGFKWFLSVTETERLKFHNAPAKSPKEFEEFLPYAMVLGVEKEWANQFASIYLTPPEWYEGRHGTAFGAYFLATSLGSMSSNLNSAMVTAPSKSSTAGFGGSGFGGGGFSGGGFGGGGGGSW
jgi:uncharacterized membrane protein